MEAKKIEGRLLTRLENKIWRKTFKSTGDKNLAEGLVKRRRKRLLRRRRRGWG